MAYACPELPLKNYLFTINMMDYSAHGSLRDLHQHLATPHASEDCDYRVKFNDFARQGYSRATLSAAQLLGPANKLLVILGNVKFGP
jgi:hypothetical protein